MALINFLTILDNHAYLKFTHLRLSLITDKWDKIQVFYNELKKNQGYALLFKAFFQDFNLLVSLKKYRFWIIGGNFGIPKRFLGFDTEVIREHLMHILYPLGRTLVWHFPHCFLVFYCLCMARETWLIFISRFEKDT